MCFQKIDIYFRISSTRPQNISCSSPDLHLVKYVQLFCQQICWWFLMKFPTDFPMMNSATIWALFLFEAPSNVFAMVNAPEYSTIAFCMLWSIPLEEMGLINTTVIPFLWGVLFIYLLQIGFWFGWFPEPNVLSETVPLYHRHRSVLTALMRFITLHFEQSPLSPR